MKKKEYCALGIMSGTSIDGLDFSLIKTDGKSNIKNLINEYYKFSDNFKDSIKKLIKKVNNIDYKLILKSDESKKFNEKFTELLFKQIKLFLYKNSIDIKSLDVIGIHGNTIIHKPRVGLSFQLGLGEVLSKKLNTIVVSDFRNNDIKQKGQGAPLVPKFHHARFSEKNKNVMVVNLGGISNFTLLKGKRQFFASDIGPGNKLIDEFCNLKFKIDYDKNGELSSKGKLIFKLLEEWKDKKFLKIPIPISFDNAFFKLEEFIQENNANRFDLLRTLTYFSAYLIFHLKSKIKCNVDKWVFSGGGVKNKTLMLDIKNLLGVESIYTTREYNLNPFFIEAQAFAYISVRTLKKLPSSYPKTTGCLKSSISGSIFYPN